MSTMYVGYEVLRAVRNRRFMLFSFGFPLVLFLVVAGSNKDVSDFAGTGISFPLYYMVGMVSWGSMAAVLAGGARIALERQVGWVRQLRITPLPARTYLGAKVASGYALAAVSITVLYTAGAVYGVRLPAGSWVRMTVLILIGLVPFAIMGIWLGHALTPDSMGPALGGIAALFALLGGAWGPIVNDTGWMHALVQLLPSYWLTQASRTAFTGQWWPLEGWLVVIGWTAVLAVLARQAYRRDEQR